MQTIQLKRGKALCLAELNPKPEAGELIFEIDTGHFKIGDGIRRWNSLPYADRAGAHTHVVGDILGLQTVLDNKQVVGNYVTILDSRLTDARVPVAHASTHAANGSDPISIAASQVSGLATVATSGSYDDLADKPTNLSTDWPDITNKPNFAAVATSGSYADLSGTITLSNGVTIEPTGSVTVDPDTGATNPFSVGIAFNNGFSSLSYTVGDFLACRAVGGGLNAIVCLSPVEFPAQGVPNATPMRINSAGLQFPDGTTQTTALPTATSTVLGGVKIGTGVTITDGVISVSTDYAATSHTHGNITNDGKIGTAADKIIVTTADGVLIAADNIAATQVTGLATVATSGSYTDLTSLPTLFDGAYSSLTGAPSLATVATSGSYADLSGAPSLATVATSGSYNDLTSLPTLFDGAYSSLSGAPSLATVATSGSYSDLSGTPSLATVATSGSYADLSGAPSLATVATSGSYTDLSGTPSLATVATSGSYDDLTSLPTLFDGAYTSLSGAPSLATVATSGSYADLTSLPTLFDGAYTSLSGAPSLATVATSGSYSDLSGTPSLATVATSGSYADLYGAPSLATVATSGSYADLSGAPSLATVATSGSYTDLTNTPSAYTLPTADATTLGGVKIGSGVSIDSNGVISVSTTYAASSHTHAASDITSGTIDTARLGSGTASSSTFLRGDQTWATVSSGSTSASDLTSGTLSDARLSPTAQDAINLHPFLLAGM